MNKSKVKGTAWESAIVTWLRDAGYPATRIVLHGSLDQGDIDTGATWNLEAKSCRTLQLGAWVAEADAESRNSGRPVALFVKRIGKTDPGEGFVIMPGRLFLAVVLPLFRPPLSGLG